jgi:undecaprenyl-diphosphatase
MKFDDLLRLDAEISNRLRVAETPGPLRSLAAFLGHSGDSWFWLLGLLVLGLAGGPDWKFRAGVLAVAILLTALVVMALKFSIRRRRPEGEWGQIYRRTDPHSFPSGHAARGLLIGVVALGLGPAWFGTLLIVWGPLVGVARIATGLHYVSDILGGWLLGLGMGLLVLAFLPRFL